MGHSKDELLKTILPALRVVRGPDRRGEYVAWCPFHPDGQGTPPHQPNLSVSERGFICHACGANGGLAKLARHLGVTMKQVNEDIEATYDYRNEQADLLFQVVRMSGKRFRQRRRGDGDGWVWNVKGVRRVLYRLPDLLARSDSVVFVVEGEKDADRLYAAGLLSTTNPGGVNKWHPEHSECLKNRDVTILPDNDEPGRRHAEKVASSLKGLARSVRIVRLSGVPEKGDVSDWLNAGHTVEELAILCHEAPEWEGSASEPEVEDQPSTGKPRLAEQLAEIAIAAGVTLFHDQRKAPMAMLSKDGERRLVSLEGREFGRWLDFLAWKEMRRAFSTETRTAARNVLAAKALFEGPQHTLHVRVARHENAIWIDLDGARAVRVLPGHWEIVNVPPPLFRAFPHLRALPEPVPSGDPWQLIWYVNLRDDASRLLLMCYLVAAFVPDIPVAALVIHGVQGSSKTTLLKMVKRLLDPSAVEVRGGVRDLTEFAQAASQNRVLYFDNLSYVPDWLSDALCRSTTGEGWAKRTLYSDEETTFVEYRGVIGLAGINLVADRADLLDRALILPLEPVAPSFRREERSLWADFEGARPKILGGLLDALAKAMLIEPNLVFESLPRMADFARWGAAAAQALGFDAGDFISAYGRNVDRQNEAAVDGSPVAQAVIASMASRSEWEGSSASLLEELTSVAGEIRADVKDRKWPKNASWLSRRLREVQPNLLTLGVEVEEVRSGERRTIRLRRAGGNAVIGVTGDITTETNGVTGDGTLPLQGAAVTVAVMTNPAETQRLDGSDTNDGIPAGSSGGEVENAA